MKNPLSQHTCLPEIETLIAQRIVRRYGGAGVSKFFILYQPMSACVDQNSDTEIVPLALSQKLSRGSVNTSH